MRTKNKSQTNSKQIKRLISLKQSKILIKNTVTKWKSLPDDKKKNKAILKFYVGLTYTILTIKVRPREFNPDYMKQFNDPK